MWARKAWNTLLEATVVDARVPTSDACLSAPNAVGADTDIVEGEGDYVGVAIVDVELSRLWSWSEMRNNTRRV